MRNSNINLELYNLHELSWFSLLVYFSYLMMLLSIPLLLNFVRPWIRMIFGKKFDASSALNRTVMACLTALYFVTAAAKLGFVKEDNKMDGWKAFHGSRYRGRTSAQAHGKLDRQ